ncbi:hypothetical protein [Spiroplasma endosymbiont of Amphibalanus improvisus]|uniref:hypothetical protein n=1 Tax=Spiroplasma endosymbiont of Amphibalanus improvisus TaxID=3066327 RepID=UPI00313E812C
MAKKGVNSNNQSPVNNNQNLTRTIQTNYDPLSNTSTLFSPTKVYNPVVINPNQVHQNNLQKQKPRSHQQMILKQKNNNFLWAFLVIIIIAVFGSIIGVIIVSINNKVEKYNINTAFGSSEEATLNSNSIYYVNDNFNDFQNNFFNITYNILNTALPGQYPIISQEQLVIDWQGVDDTLPGTYGITIFTYGRDDLEGKKSETIQVVSNEPNDIGDINFDSIFDQEYYVSNRPDAIADQYAQQVVQEINNATGVIVSTSDIKITFKNDTGIGDQNVLNASRDTITNTATIQTTGSNSEITGSSSGHKVKLKAYQCDDPHLWYENPDTNSRTSDAGDETSGHLRSDGRYNYNTKKSTFDGYIDRGAHQPVLYNNVRYKLAYSDILYSIKEIVKTPYDQGGIPTLPVDDVMNGYTNDSERTLLFEKYLSPKNFPQDGTVKTWNYDRNGFWKVICIPAQPGNGVFEGYFYYHICFYV